MPDHHEHDPEHFAHVAAKVADILSGPLADIQNWPEERRWWFQLGFNLGRFSELSGEGKPVWDAWKQAIEDRDEAILVALTEKLRAAAEASRRKSGAS